MNAIELADRLDNWAKADFEANKRFGRKGPEWAIESELGYRAARLLREMHEALEPFAAIAAGYEEDDDDDFQVWKDFDLLGASLPLSIFRRARKAYEAKP